LQREKTRTQIKENIKSQKRQNSIIKKAFLTLSFLEFPYPDPYTPELSLAFRKELVQDFTSHFQKGFF
jgi:hypothetical protein